MNTGNILELAIIAFIVIGIGAAIWRGGARNPVGTGGLDTRLSLMAGEVHRVVGKVGEIENRVEEIEGHGASKEDIRRLEKQMERQMQTIAQSLPDIEGRLRVLHEVVSEVRVNAAGRGEQLEQIERQVSRLYDVLVPKGMQR